MIKTFPFFLMPLLNSVQLSLWILSSNCMHAHLTNICSQVSGWGTVFRGAGQVWLAGTHSQALTMKGGSFGCFLMSFNSVHFQFQVSSFTIFPQCMWIAGSGSFWLRSLHGRWWGLCPPTALCISLILTGEFLPFHISI